MEKLEQAKLDMIVLGGELDVEVRFYPSDATRERCPGTITAPSYEVYAQFVEQCGSKGAKIDLLDVDTLHDGRVVVQVTVFI